MFETWNSKINNLSYLECSKYLKKLLNPMLSGPWALEKLYHLGFSSGKDKDYSFLWQKNYNPYYYNP